MTHVYIYVPRAVLSFYMKRTHNANGMKVPGLNPAMVTIFSEFSIFCIVTGFHDSP
jgi:hypothetical protein